MRARSSRPRLESFDDRVVPSFTVPTDYPVGTGSAALAVGDFTGEGVPDLITQLARTPELGVLVGNGDGTFQPVSTMPLAGGAGSLLTGDLTEDGLDDAIAVNDSSIRVLVSTGNGAFEPPQSIALPDQTPSGYTGGPLPQGPIAAVVGDLNADGHLDLVAIGLNGYTVRSGPGPYGGYYYYGVNSSYVNVLLGTGEGTFAPAIVSSGGSDYSPYVGLGDTNGDGHLDVLMYSNWQAYGTVHTLLGNGDGTFPTRRGSTGGEFAPVNYGVLPVADFNADGKLDVLMRDIGGGSAIPFLGAGDGTFTLANPTGFIAPMHGTTAVGDVNADGATDLVVVTHRTEYAGSPYEPTSFRSVRVALGNGDATFAAPDESDLGTVERSAYLMAPVLADFDGDGLPDLATSDTYFGVLAAQNAGDWSALPAFRISDATWVEGHSGSAAMKFTVSLNRAAAQTVTVRYATANETAQAGKDYTAASGTVTFAPGQTSRAVNISVTGDRIDEPDETFVIQLSSPTGAALGDHTGRGTIVDDDPPPAIRISDAAIVEGHNGTQQMKFTVTLSGPSEQTVGVYYATADGTARADDADYQAATGSLFFAHGETTRTITVLIVGDRRTEATETFSVNLYNWFGGTMLDGTGLGTIKNDD